MHDGDMNRARQIARLVIVVGLETGCLAGLLLLGKAPWLSIGWSGLGTWLRVTPADDAIAAFVWLAALGCTIWLTGSTLFYLAARAVRVPKLIRAAGWVTVPSIRRMADWALATVLVVATATATPVRADSPPPLVVAVDHDGSLLPPGLTGPVPIEPERGSGPAGPGDAPFPAFPEPPGGRSTESVKVRAGDNLWVICRRHLTGVLGHRPANAEIAPYWRTVIERNQADLISGNPDLIYPGEMIELPPIG